MAGNREVGFPKTTTREQLARSLSGNDEGSDLCSNDEDKVKVLDHDFGVVTLTYDYELGKSGLFDDMKLSLSSSGAALTENDEGS
ncbi:hypothetical protein OIU77_004806 [Salix suchowensis]|uniref:Uncharacterized protein n=1 Tax=Salix suchowensis TaxID=1278906 RepID=A0ABQ9AVW0_9ROSI|nr:hypothetical protein OIU77_004806 [Salix suchowensis]